MSIGNLNESVVEGNFADYELVVSDRGVEVGTTKTVYMTATVVNNTAKTGSMYIGGNGNNVRALVMNIVSLPACVRTLFVIHSRVPSISLPADGDH